MYQTILNISLKFQEKMFPIANNTEFLNCLLNVYQLRWFSINIIAFFKLPFSKMSHKFVA